LTWWVKGDNAKTGKPISPYADKDVIIADGAVRSGKTVIMSLSFVIWSMSEFSYTKFGMAGKTIGSFRRNVLFLLKIILRLRGYRVRDKRSDSLLIVSKNNVENYYYIFGGKDEGSQELVQGFTSGGFFFDEVSLMPESFVNQAVARCSEEGRKLWFNCNPDGEYHWFKVGWIDQLVVKNALHIHFLLDDNPSLSKKTIEFYKRMFTGVFYKRFILGLWVLAEGIIYDMFEEDNVYVDGDGPDYGLYHKRWYAIDYGTTNPFVCLEIIEQAHKYYVENEYYYSSKERGRQKDDAEYVDDIVNFISGKPYHSIIVDPSAASFKIAARKKGLRMRDANNDVLDGIRLLASMIALRMMKVNKRCKMLLKERASYIWDEKAAMEHGVERPVKENDHAMDAWRYFAKTVVRAIKGTKEYGNKRAA
jgi:PBSX family phage terminase large subunit